MSESTSIDIVKPTIKSCVVSKKKYMDFVDGLKRMELDEDIISNLTNLFCSSLKYDPDFKNDFAGYYRAQAASKGISVYELKNQKAYYEKNKTEINKKRNEYLKKAREEARKIKTI